MSKPASFVYATAMEVSLVARPDTRTSTLGEISILPDGRIYSRGRCRAHRLRRCVMCGATLRTPPLSMQRSNQ